MKLADFGLPTGLTILNDKYVKYGSGSNVYEEYKNISLNSKQLICGERYFHYR